MRHRVPGLRGDLRSQVALGVVHGVRRATGGWREEQAWHRHRCQASWTGRRRVHPCVEENIGWVGYVPGEAVVVLGHGAEPSAAPNPLVEVLQIRALRGGITVLPAPVGDVDLGVLD